MTSHGMERTAPLVTASGVEAVVLVDENGCEIATSGRLAARSA